MCSMRSGCTGSRSGRQLPASFLPPRAIVQLRDFSRHRIDLVASRGAEKNRVEKLLEDACIKVSVVASDILGRVAVH